METINDRMEIIVNEYFNGNKAAFAKAISVEPTTMSSYLGKQRRSKPSVDMIAKIVVALNVDARWLLVGEGALATSDTIVNGNGSVAVSDNNNVTSNTGESAVLQERVKLLEQLLDEKERLIKVLMEK